jgi:hypothetical protein
MHKQIAILGILVFLFLADAQESKEVNSVFDAAWDGPIFTILLGKVGGYLPDKFSYQESTWKNRRRKEEFFMALDDNAGKSWARFHSDTTNESAVWLPRKPKEILNVDVIRFIRTLRRMFMDTSRHNMNGIFTFGRKKLHAQAEEFGLSGDEKIKFGRARAFTILTFDTLGTQGIRGRVVVARDSVLHFRKVSIFLPEDEIEATLEETEKRTNP